MRVLLGDHNNGHLLLVEVDGEYDPARFDFYSVTGGWEGSFEAGRIHVKPLNEFYDGAKIISVDQDRLQGDINDVTDNFKPKS